MSCRSCPSQLLHRSRRDMTHSMASPWSCKSKSQSVTCPNFSVTFQRKFQRNKIYILTANILLSLPKIGCVNSFCVIFQKAPKSELISSAIVVDASLASINLRISWGKTSSVLEAHKIPWALRLIKMMISDINRRRYRSCYRYPDLSLLFFVLKVAININCSPGEMTAF